MGRNEEIKVLVVDNEPDLVETYSHWLNDKYNVDTAYSGDEVLEKIHDDIDIILLDRKMPGLSGDEILENIKEIEDIDCRVAMVTAVSPDFDIINMGFDDYLVKPVNKSDLEKVVSNLLERKEYNEKSRELFSLISKKVVLEGEMDNKELEQNEEYLKLKNEINNIEADMETFMNEMTAKDFKAVLRDIPS